MERAVRAWVKRRVRSAVVSPTRSVDREADKMSTDSFEQILETAISDDSDAQTLASFAKVTIKTSESEH